MAFVSDTSAAAAEAAEAVIEAVTEASEFEASDALDAAASRGCLCRNLSGLSRNFRCQCSLVGYAFDFATDVLE